MNYESADEQMNDMKSYHAQRKERLTDAVFDYISDDRITATQTYDDLIDSVKSDAAYYKRYYEKCRDLLFKMGYYGSVDEDVSIVDGIAYSASSDEGVLKFEPPAPSAQYQPSPSAESPRNSLPSRY